MFHVWCPSTVESLGYNSLNSMLMNSVVSTLHYYYYYYYYTIHACDRQTDGRTTEIYRAICICVAQ